MSLLVAAIIPVIAFLFVIYHKDTAKEPVGLLAKCFFGGCLSILLTLVLIYFFFPSIQFANPLLRAFYDAFFQAAIPEEVAKFIILYKIVWDRDEFDQHYDGIIYAVFVSMGFALVENILYVASYGYGTAITRGIFAVPGHGICGIAMGYFFSLARFDKGDKHRRYLAYSLLSAIVLHGVYDFILMYMGADSFSTGFSLLLTAAFFLFIALEWKVGIRSIRKHLHTDKETIYRESLLRNEQPDEIEVLASLITEEQDLKNRDEPEGNEDYNRRFAPKNNRPDRDKI
ncbi:MAG TPA: PrsW family intramembrane metalloprotease [Dysgonomonas sp.]|nr:PrsW family intramembrane metalloprotease [Dysgonomonas sp.]